MEANPTDTEPDSKKSTALTLCIGAIGVVFGDIGTSPLYALRECFNPTSGVSINHTAIIGVVSLIFWAVTMTVSIKYITFVIRVDNRGEGGILALMTLAVGGLAKKGKLFFFFSALGIIGASLLYGDSIITPAISVLSAVEGLSIAAPVFKPFIIPIAVVVLTILFMFQYKGTAKVGALFGPILVCWFIVLGILGISNIVANPKIFQALNPLYGLSFLFSNGLKGFTILGFVFLSVTGGEVLYADLGHFGKKPIRRSWFSLVYPCLILNYLGQGAFLLASPTLVDNLFYRLAPSWMLLPLVVLATMATIIASQAVISGAFSVSRNIIQLGFWPRLKIIHTSPDKIGQVYIPFVNWALFLGTVTLVLVFKESTNLAGAYGIAVSTTEIITTVLLVTLSRKISRMSLPLAIGFGVVFICIDLAFFAANIAKLFTGGWVIVLISSSIYFAIKTWQKGRDVIWRQIKEGNIDISVFVKDIKQSHPVRVPGIAVFLAGNPHGIPRSLLHNYKHNKIIHEKTVILSVQTEDKPFMTAEERMEIEHVGEGIWRMLVRYGFSESPDIPRMLASIRNTGFSFAPMETTYFLGRESQVISNRPTMWLWQKQLFRFMSHNALDASTFFKLPPNRVVELGLQVEL